LKVKREKTTEYDNTLAEKGRRMLDWTEIHMPVLMIVRNEHSDTNPAVNYFYMPSRPGSGKKHGSRAKPLF